VVVDAGLGAPSHASSDGDGADAVPGQYCSGRGRGSYSLARGVQKRVEAGREAFLAGGLGSPRKAARRPVPYRFFE